MEAYFDIWTVIFYVIVGFFIVALIKSMMQKNSQTLLGSTKNGKLKPGGAAILFILLLTIVATLRKVSGHVGGADASNYIINFQTVINRSYFETMTGKNLEPGFQLFTAAIRNLTDEYRIYFIVIYSFIAYSYVKFIKDKCPRGLIYIPFILVMYIYLRSFNTIRTSMAVGLVLIGLSMMDKRKWLSLVYILASVSFHRMCLLFVPVWGFYYFFGKKLNEIKRWKFVFYAVSGLVVTYLLSIQVQLFVGESLALDDLDVYYTTHSMGENHLERYPLVLGHLLLFAAIAMYYNKIEWNEKTIYLRTIFLYDLWIVPAGVILGMWRFVEFFYLVRLSLWCVIIYSLTRKVPKNKKEYIHVMSFLLFGAWLVFRIFKEWDSAKISPYIFDLF